MFRMADLATGRWLQRVLGALRGQAIDFGQQGRDGGVDLVVRAAVS